MENYLIEYEKWLHSPLLDKDTIAELENIKNDQNAIKERFSKNLEFGTGGMRGIVGAGTARMNKYTIAKTTQGLANYILETEATSPSCVISFDPRHNSIEFATITALTLNANGIKTYIYDQMRPTPQLSFSVRYLNCSAGVMVTASHNPPEYNGYKVYGPDGAQVTSPNDLAIMKHVLQINDLTQVKTISKDEAIKNGLYNIVPKIVEEKFLTHALNQRIHPQLATNTPLKIVYSPLHGAGYVPITNILKMAGYLDVHCVKEQTVPCGNFSTVSSPNPEDPTAFVMGIEKATQINADIILATDPDADRVGVVAKDKDGKYAHFPGNTLGTLIANYILEQLSLTKKLPPNPAIITSIVSTQMTKQIATYYGANYYEVLTGFKHFGKKIKELEETTNQRFVYGFEESFGYSISDFQRDKDAVCVSLIICEMANFYKEQGLSLWEATELLYKKFGYYADISKSIVLKGLDGNAKIQKIMNYFEENCPKTIADLDVLEYLNYQTSIKLNTQTLEQTKITLPKSYVLYYKLANNSWACIRPSGTEPKIKIYVGAVGEANQEAFDNANKIIQAMLTIISSV